MKYLLSTILIISFLILPSSCEDQLYFVDCSHCYTEKPTHAEIEISITFNKENPFVYMTIFEGAIEKNNIISEEVVYKVDAFYRRLPVEKYYSVMVRYIKGGRSIYAVDGKKLRLRKDESSCDEPCYYVLGDDFDLRLKE